MRSRVRKGTAMNGLDAVTGSFGYSGSYITRRLLAQGRRVRTLTNHPRPDHPLASSVDAVPLCFDRPEDLARSLDGVETLVNTYWVRFDHGSATFDNAVANTKTLFDAAKRAGVRRIVHISIANPDPASPLPYYAGKGRLEAYLRDLGVPYAIVRPTVIFGPEDILINNIAWIVRRFPVFALPGDGSYGIQPGFVEDQAELVASLARTSDNVTVDAVGPETYTFADLVRMIARTLGRRTLIVKTPPSLALQLSRAIGAFTHDVVLTRDEVCGLMSGLLVSNDPPTGATKLSEWVAANRATLGVGYHSELSRHYVASGK